MSNSYSFDSTHAGVASVVPGINEALYSSQTAAASANSSNLDSAVNNGGDPTAYNYQDGGKRRSTKRKPRKQRKYRKRRRSKKRVTKRKFIDELRRLRREKQRGKTQRK